RETVQLAKAVERAGATIINTGIGWHEARVPTIATSVPRGAFAWVTKKMKGEVGIPLVTTNRINRPEVAEQILADGCADMVSMARPLLADAEFVVKAAQGRAFVRCATLAREAGYDGVEIMGSEGYLINQFISMHTNKRSDEWGGAYENRIRLPIEIVERTREAVGRDFILIYRLSMLDLIPDGSDWRETVQLAKAVERAGATIINTGIGWHEARVPT
ncbi:NADPH-dependent 2,4-dienoyl-CoA reductase, partial [Burkholderia cenocepacia]|nr:NADPH-dependent 2,4-dienoyl-CoA reductase [Burkholderia cenocepacia]MDR5668117.1 NADPH-dependent 2,4-dienoyl-CoA reductase [Burkholderia cenocepacia]